MLTTLHWGIYGGLKVPPEDEIHQEEKARRRERSQEDKARNHKGKILDLVKSTSSGRKDKKRRSWISSIRLDDAKKTRAWILTWWGWEDKKTISLSSQLYEEEKTERRNSESSHVDLIWTRRQEDKILDLVKSSSWGWKDEKTRYWRSSSRLYQDEKTRYWILSSRLHQVKSTYL